MRTLLTILCAAALSSGCYDSRFGERGSGGSPPPATTTIGSLNALYAGTTFPVTGNVVVTGTVTANGRGDNFYRTICIEQDGSGMEIMAGADQLHNDFPEGIHITLRLKGLAIGKSRGVLQAGIMPLAGSGYAVDYISSKPLLDKALMRNHTPGHPIVPAVRSIAELQEEMCGTLVRIEGVKYTPEDLTEGTWAGYKPFTDSSGAEIVTYVRAYASFAANEVPLGRHSLTGILQWDAPGERFTLKLRDESDCAP